MIEAKNASTTELLRFLDEPDDAPAAKAKPAIDAKPAEPTNRAPAASEPGAENLEGRDAKPRPDEAGKP
jgi:hypothetical protein